MRILVSLSKTEPGIQLQLLCKRTGNPDYYLLSLLFYYVIIIFSRVYLSSWASPSGVYLLGEGDTTELIKEDGTTVAKFNLKYSIR